MSRRSRRSETQPKYTPDELEAEAPAEDDMDEEDENEVTRCVCGRAELDSDATDPGFFIQCESCSVWQHGNCVGIADETSAPDIYWCEQCRPEMHSLFKDEDGIIKSRYDPTRSNSRTRVDPRDQHYESMLKRALEESARESHPNDDESIPAEEAVKIEEETPIVPPEVEIKDEPQPRVKSVSPPKEHKPRKSKKTSNASKVTKPSSSSAGGSSGGNGNADANGFKANIPASRISYPEMTRRIFAIMEFLANIQSNLSAEDKFREILHELENKNLDRTITGSREDLIKMYNESVEGVDELMTLVNEWVETYD